MKRDFAHTALLACAACICTLAQFTPPEKGYLWQLIMPSFMHINEPCEQPLSLLQRGKNNSSLNGKQITKNARVGKQFLIISHF